jgi:hypothetical protein
VYGIKKLKKGQGPKGCRATEKNNQNNVSPAKEQETSYNVENIHEGEYVGICKEDVAAFKLLS